MKACPECGQRFAGAEEFCPKDGSTLVEMDKTDDDPLIGTILDGRYAIDKKIGEGGMGVVYLATHATIGKKCAVKVLRGELSQEAEVAERFTQEARAAAAIGSEHIIDITDFGQLADGSAYFIMEFLDGIALHDALANNQKLEIEPALHILGQCCDALAAAHKADIVHRDLKPDNIFLIKRGGDPNFIKILDFGIAKVARESGRLTRTGMIFGTPQYMSPEQAAGTEMDARTDIYSLGIIMYEMICGHVPFEADTFMGVLTKHLYEEPIPPRQLIPPVDIPPSVEAVLIKAIAKKPEKRYQNMDEFAEDIRSLMSGKTPTIVYDQMRSTSMSTVPPPSPTAIVTGQKTPRAFVNDPTSMLKQKWPLFAGVGGAALVLLIVLAFVFGSGGDEQDANASPNGGETGVAPAPVQAVAEPKGPTLVKISGDPAGASLYKDGAMMGPLPIDVPKPEMGSAGERYQVQKEGFKTLDVVIAATSPVEFKVTLQKEAAKPKPVPKTVEKPKKRPARKKVETIRVTKPKPKSKPKPKPKPKKKSASDLADPWAD